jgi:hypothetical protein
MSMQAAAEIPTLIAICFRCRARFAGAEPSACPGCGGAVILELDGWGQVRENLVVQAEDPAPGGDRPSYLPGVHIKLAPAQREKLAARCTPRGAVRTGGGTSVHASRASAATQAPRQGGGWAVTLMSMAALLATFALFLQSAH